MATIVVKTQKELDTIQRLLSKTVTSKSLGCWEFVGLLDKKGYGKIRYGNIESAHRLSYHLFNGPLIKGMDVAHECDNPKCVNPKHLSQQTRKENSNAAVLRGRIKKGLDSPNSVLNKTDIEEIVLLKKRGWSNSKIATLYSVSIETIRRSTKAISGQINLRSFLHEQINN